MDLHGRMLGYDATQRYPVFQSEAQNMQSLATSLKEDPELRTFIYPKSLDAWQNLGTCTLVNFVQDLQAYHYTMEMYSASSPVLGMVEHSRPEVTSVPAYPDPGSDDADVLNATTMRRTGLPRGAMEPGTSLMHIPGPTFQMMRDSHPELLDQFLTMRGWIRVIDGTTLPAAPRPTLPWGVSSPVATPPPAGVASPLPPPNISNGIGKQYGKQPATTGTNGATLLAATATNLSLSTMISPTGKGMTMSPMC
jgi:hypothetical protein